MSRIMENPTGAICPDYTSADHTTLREPLVNNGSTDEQAAQLLAAIWNSSHVINCQRWQVQVDADIAAMDAHKAERGTERKRVEDEAEKERTEFEKEERKKNKSKYGPIIRCPIPSQQPVIASPVALRKLTKGDYVGLWYWTTARIDSASTSFFNTDSQNYNFVSDADGNTTLTPATSEKESNSFLPDGKIPFDDFLVAIPRHGPSTMASRSHSNDEHLLGQPPMPHLSFLWRP